MFPICFNNQFKLQRNRKRFTKNNKMKPFINKYNWEGINSPSEKDDWKILKKIM